MPMGSPGWPDCEVSMASTARKRTALARSLCVTAVRSASAWTEMFIGSSPRSLQVSLALDELHDQRRQDQLHGKIELRAGHTIEIARDNQLCGNNESREGKSMPRGVLKRNTTIDSS